MDNNYQYQFEETSLSVVIPAFNEEKLIKKSITLLDNLLKTLILDYEIIVVNDGSTDATAEALEQLSLEIKKLKKVISQRNQGLGAALRKGFAASSKELVLYVDADMPVDYKEIARAITFLKTDKTDIVLGVRCNYFYNSIIRSVASLSYNWLIRTIFSFGIKDVNCPFKLLKRKMLKELNLKSSGIFISAEIVIKTAYLGYSIKQIEVDYFEREIGCSRLFNLRAITHILFEIIKYYSEIVKLKKCFSRKNRTCSTEF